MMKSALFDVDVTDGNDSTGFVSFHSSLFDGSLAVHAALLSDSEKENYSGRLFLLRNDDKSSSLEAAQFELFAPINADNVAFFWKKAFWKKKEEEEGVRAIIRSTSNQRFLSIKSGGNPFATEKDPALATVFILERFLLKVLWLFSESVTLGVFYKTGHGTLFKKYQNRSLSFSKKCHLVIKLAVLKFSKRYIFFW